MQVKDETELRTKISENIENQKKQQNADGERQQITEELVKAVDFPVPESGVESETEAVLRDFMQRNMQQGVSAEEFEKHKESLARRSQQGSARSLQIAPDSYQDCREGKD